MNGAASMSQRTGGLRRPPSTAPLTTVLTAFIGLAPRAGVKPMSCMSHQATTSVRPSRAARTMYGTPRSVTWATTPPADGPDEHRAAADDLRPAEDGLERIGRSRSR